MELHTSIPIIHPYKDNCNNPSLEIHKGQKGGINILRKPTIIEKTSWNIFFEQTLFILEKLNE